MLASPINTSLFAQNRQYDYKLTYDSLTTLLANPSLTEKEQLAVYLGFTAKVLATDTSKMDQHLQTGINLATKLGDDSARLVLMITQGGVLLEAGSSDKALANYQQVIEEAEAAQYTGLLAKGHYKLGIALNENQEFEQAKPHIEQAIQLYKNTADTLNLARSYDALGHVYSLNNAFHRGEEYYRLGLKLTQNLKANRVIASLLKNLGTSLLMQRRFNEAEQYLLQGMAMAKSINDKEVMLGIGNGLGRYHTYIGNYAQAASYYQACIQLSKVLGTFTLANHNLGAVYKQRGILDSAIFYYRQSAISFGEIQSTYGAANAIHAISGCYFSLGQTDSADFYFNKAINICLENNHNKLLAQLYSIKGGAVANKGKLSEALEWYDQAYNIAASTQDTLELGRVSLRIARAHTLLENANAAITNYEQAVAFFKAIRRPSSVATVEYYMAMLQLENKNYQQAILLLRSSMNSFLSLGDSCSVMKPHYSLARAYRITGQLDSAKLYLDQALKMSAQCNEQRSLIVTQLELGRYYEATEQLGKAFAAYKQAYALTENSQDREVIKNVAERLYPLYEQQGNLAKALEVFKVYKANSDSLFNKANLYALARQQVAYGYEKEKQQIALAQQQKDAAQALLVARQQWYLYGIIGALVAMAFIALAMYRSYRTKQKANVVLQQQKQALEALDRAKTQLFTNISHELRTPLTLISSPLQSLRVTLNGHLPPPATGHLQLIEKNSQQLKSLVDDILDLAKLETDTIALHKQATAVPSLLSRLAGNYESLAQHLGIGYTLQVNDQLAKVWLLLDAEKIGRVINNLLSNALKHTPGGGQVTLSATRNDDQLLIAVHDTGQGITEKDLPYIFDRFYQSQQPDAPFQGGTGIGLALAKELALLMEGTLTVESTPGKGSTFTLALPYVSTEAPAQAVVETPQQAPATDNSNGQAVNLDHLNLAYQSNEKTHHVLIVEDQPDMQQFIADLLAPRYHIVRAANGREALELLPKTQVDLIVTDVMMPEIDGYTLLKEVKAQPAYANLPVVMLTALGDEAHRLEALTMGVDDYLAKPFMPEELLARVHNLLHNARQRQLWVQNELTSQEVLSTTIGNQQTAATPQPATVAAPAETGDQAFIASLARVIQEELENPDFQLTALGERFHMSDRQLQRKVKSITGLTPTQFRQEVALQQARKLLEQGVYNNASAITYSVGMTNVTRFNRLYEARFGKHPSAYFS